MAPPVRKNILDGAKKAVRDGPTRSSPRFGRKTSNVNNLATEVEEEKGDSSTNSSAKRLTVANSKVSTD